MNRFRRVPGFSRLFDLGRVLDEHRGYRKYHWKSLESSYRSLATTLFGKVT
jgi:hypothetical protein